MDKYKSFIRSKETKHHIVPKLLADRTVPY
jgi:hypothetical protein